MDEITAEEVAAAGQIHKQAARVAKKRFREAIKPFEEAVNQAHDAYQRAYREEKKLCRELVEPAHQHYLRLYRQLQAKKNRKQTKAVSVEPVSVEPTLEELEADRAYQERMRVATEVLDKAIAEADQKTGSLQQLYREIMEPAERIYAEAQAQARRAYEQALDEQSG